MNILITGCCGLIGNNFTRYLLNKGHTVIGIDDFSGSYEDYLPSHKNFIFYNFNLIDSNKLKILFDNHKPDAVYHFAAYASEGLSPFIRTYNYTNNIICSSNVINECIKNDSKLIFTSSMAVYGEQLPPFTENVLPKPFDPYGIAKYAVEMDIETANTQFGLKYTIVRPHNVLGIYQNIWDKYRNVIGIFIRKTLNNEPILIYGDGNQTRAFSDIDYYMNPFYNMLDKLDGHIFNIGADKYYSLNDIANIVKNISKNYGFNPAIEYGEKRHEVKHAYCDHSKAKLMLNFEDHTDIEKLIEKMFIWAITQPNRPIKNMNYEIEKNIYSYWK
jgi:UDP-glucose 4-epimerase